MVKRFKYATVFIDPSWGSHFFDAEVIRWQIFDSELQSAHVVYTIVVKEFYTRTDFISWQITKRYREFSALYDVVWTL